MSRYRVVDFAEVPSHPCPCGTTRRAFTDDADRVASMHVVDVNGEATTHYHRYMTELYYILEGSGELELDGERIRVQPGMAILIKPGCRHRAIGQLRLLNVPVPAFDPADEWFDE